MSDLLTRGAFVAALPLVAASCARFGVEPGSTLSLEKEPDAICVPLQPARNAYASIRQVAILILEHAGREVAAGRRTSEEAAAMERYRRQFRDLDFQIARGLNAPKAELDMAKIQRVAEGTAKIIGALL
jgi:hypothetical protein